MQNQKNKQKLRQQPKKLQNQLAIVKYEARTLSKKPVQKKTRQKQRPKLVDADTSTLIRALANPMHTKAEGAVSTVCKDSCGAPFRASIDVTTDNTGTAVIVLTANPLCSAFALQGNISGQGVSTQTDRSGSNVNVGTASFTQLANYNCYRVVSAGASFKTFTPDLNNGGKVSMGTTEVISSLPIRPSFYGSGALGASPAVVSIASDANYSLVSDFIFEAFGCTNLTEIDMSEMHQIVKSVDDLRRKAVVFSLKPNMAGDRLKTFYNLRMVQNGSGLAASPNTGIGSPFDALGFDIGFIYCTGCAANTTIGTIEQVIHLEYHETVKRSGFGISSGSGSNATSTPYSSRQLALAHDVANTQPSVFHDMEEEAIGAGSALTAPTLFNYAKNFFSGAAEDIGVDAVEVALPAIEEALPLLMLM